jgi:aldehyde:ferredoxin oxidoreductase
MGLRQSARFQGYQQPRYFLGRGDAEQAVKIMQPGLSGMNSMVRLYLAGDQAYKTGIYSKYKAEWVAWHMHYWNYYKESVGFCDWGYCNLGANGRTPTAEPTFLNAITGRNHSFNDGLEIGRRAWNLKRAIFVCRADIKNGEFYGISLQTRRSYCGFYNNLPILKGDKWEIQNCKELYFSREGVDQFKTHFYNVEGWNPDSGYPTRKTLEGLGMPKVADYLKSKYKLG